MTSDEFVASVRKGDTKFRASKIVLKAEGQTIRGQGLLSVVGDDFQIKLEVPQKYKIPEPKREIWKPADAWKISGLIESDLKFASDSVSPQGYSPSWRFGRKPSFIQYLRLDRINLIPEGFDALSRVRRDKILQRPPTKRAKHPDVEFHAVLFDCEPVFFNAGTATKITNDFLGLCGGGSAFDTFIDRGKEYDFALRKKDGDTHIHFRSKYGFRSISQEGDWRRFRAFLMGVGFTHGFQPWPYRIEFWRAGKKIADQFRPPYKLTKTRYAPFDKGIGLSGNLHKKGTRNSVIKLAARFFEKQTDLSKQVSDLLFHFREIGDVGFRIKTLPLCSLFEKTVSTIFAGLELETKLRRDNPQFCKYRTIRDRLVRRLRTLAKHEKSETFERLANHLSSASEFRTLDKFKAICTRFNLPFEGEMEKHLSAWSRMRHIYAHGNWRDQDSDFSDQALIAGAINIFVLKVMGFSGRMKFHASAQEIKDRYRII